MNRKTVPRIDLELGAKRIRLIGRLLSRVGQAGAAAGGPTRSEQAILALLEDVGPLTIKRLADLESLRSQSVAQTVDGLEQAGLIRRERNTEDRREVLNTITAAGRLALDLSRQVRQQWLVRAFEQSLNQDEQQRLMSALELLERVAHTNLDT
jgi:DNA-binding MarR family transcriptional regulator